MNPILGPEIPPFAPAELAPPARLGPFLAWALKGAWGGILWASFWSAPIAGSLEAVSATILGYIRRRCGGGRRSCLGDCRDHWLLVLLFLGFYLILRPAVLGLNTASASIRLEPNLFPLILSRLHRFTIGQAVTFFDNDFAGRIAQKQMQTARAATDVVAGTIETMAFSLSSVVGSIILLGAIDARVSLLLILWITAYGLFIRVFLPRIRSASAKRAAARAMVTGQIVDTVTNMKTVKLFAHSAHEDAVALEAMGSFRTSAISYGMLSSWFRFGLTVLAGILPVLLVGSTVWLWQLGQASAGEIAAAGAISFRLSQMTGWVSFSLMSIFGNIGEVEDGIRTLARPYTLVDAADADEMPQAKGEIKLEDVSFAYGRKRKDGRGGVSALSLTVAPGRKDRCRRCLGCRKVDAGRADPAALRSRTGPCPDRRDRPSPGHAGILASPDRHGHPGNRNVQPHRAREHPLRQPRHDRGAGDRRCPRPPRRMISSWV